MNIRALGPTVPFLLALASLDCGNQEAEGVDDFDNTSVRTITVSGPVIIGAGVAGARAAYELKKAGIGDITVIAPEVYPGANSPDTGLTTTLPLPNGGMVDVGATLFPDTYEILGVARELGVELVPFSTTLAIVRGGKPVVIDQADGMSLYNLFTPAELTPTAAAGVQAEIGRLYSENYNHRDGRLYAKETRTIEDYLVGLVGEVPAQYLSVIPNMLGGQDPKTASAGFQQTLYVMTAPKMYTSPQMQALPLKMIGASGANVELAKIDKVEEHEDGVVVDGTRASGEHVRWISSAPVIVATPASVSAKLVKDAGDEESALLTPAMRQAHALTIELTPGWKRPAALEDTTYGGVPEVERGNDNVRGWALDFRSPQGQDKWVILTLEKPVSDQDAIDAAVRQGEKYLPGLAAHVKSTTPVTNPVHAPALTPQFYESVDTYWKWIAKTSSRHVILAGAGVNQYGMDAASFSGRLAAELVEKKLQK